MAHEVLIVEDEPLSRLALADALAEAGFSVHEAGDADEAMAILEIRSDIHIVITDVDMPGSMDGLKLAEFVRKRWPPINLIIVSGKMGLSSVGLPERARFLTKPYDSSILLGLVAELMDTSPR